ncbi:hypothetical protein I593_03523 [Acinetobacter tandoii DSM 14970 = CIP 107469]|uniref:Porin domain-containing protein n=2 Tax=Acinetobacter tandoii TaxID=202954 RepID=R9AQG3_9GAMM|nr:hypothetical protein I593_03523 [Acinetobacter tandoii DSM 14970 = CIP 107469]
MVYKTLSLWKLIVQPEVSQYLTANSNVQIFFKVGIALANTFLSLLITAKRRNSMWGNLRMKFTLKVLSMAVVAAASTFTFADDQAASPFGLSFSGNAAVTTDYRFRGLSQTQNDPAVQAGFTLAHDSGVYFGLWGSNINFGSGTPNLELDPSLGFATTLDSFASKPLLDVGVLYYNYPSASDLSWVEFYGKLTFASVLAEGDSILTNVNFTNDYAGADTNSWNVNAGYSVPFGSTGFGGVASVGYTVVDDEDKYSFGGDDNYVDWKVGVNYAFKSISGATAELAAVGTNIDTDAMDDATARGVETGAVFTLTKTF